jgi:hypothetical protein
VYSIDYFRSIGNLAKVLNVNRSFLKLNQFICNEQSDLPFHSSGGTAFKSSLLKEGNPYYGGPGTSWGIQGIKF